MGNIYSYHSVDENIECLICWEQVENIERIKCIRCSIQIHSYCEEVYRGEKKYCKCPHCQGIGTLYSV